MNTNSEKLREACELAAQTLRKLNPSDHEVIISKLEYCIGSYNHDKNPSGLYEIGNMALNTLKDIKQKNARKVNKVVITNLEESLAG
jgi:hypothetical protein